MKFNHLMSMDQTEIQFLVKKMRELFNDKRYKIVT